METRSVRRTDLDGLRAAAVLPVLLFHFGTPGFSGGYVGVDVFFVLSGYLITKIIHDDLRHDRFSLLEFYDRRIRRIIPALAAMLIVTSAVAFAVLLPIELKEFGQTSTAAAASVSNIWFYFRSDYFSAAAETQALLHTWSLGVEEQFYLLFPIILAGVFRYRRTWLAGVVMALLAMSFVACIVVTDSNQAAAFYLSHHRAWELLIGSALALGLAPQTSSQAWREAAAGLGLAAIAAASVFYTRETRFPGVAALVPCVGAALVIWSGEDGASRRTVVARLLSVGPVVFIGLISYSLYLWHWPVVVFTKLTTVGGAALNPLVLLALSLALAAASWKFIEQPFRRSAPLWRAPRQRIGMATLTLVSIAGGGVAATVFSGFPQRLPETEQALLKTSADFSRYRPQCHFELAKFSEAPDYQTSCVLGAAGAPGAIVFGDSHGVELSAALGELAAARGASIRELTASGCPPSQGIRTPHAKDCAEHVEAMLAALTRLPPTIIVLAANYHSWGKLDGFWQGLDATVTALRASGHHIILVGQVPPHPDQIHVPRALARWSRQGGQLSAYEFVFKDAKTIEARLAEISHRHGVQYVALTPFLCPGGRCNAFRDGAVLYFDDDHLSMSGARLVAAALLDPAIRAGRWHLPALMVGPVPVRH